MFVIQKSICEGILDCEDVDLVDVLGLEMNPIQDGYAEEIEVGPSSSLLLGDSKVWVGVHDFLDKSHVLLGVSFSPPGFKEQNTPGWNTQIGESLYHVREEGCDRVHTSAVEMDCTILSDVGNYHHAIHLACVDRPFLFIQFLHLVQGHTILGLTEAEVLGKRTVMQNLVCSSTEQGFAIQPELYIPFFRFLSDGPVMSKDSIVFGTHEGFGTFLAFRLDLVFCMPMFSVLAINYGSPVCDDCVFSDIDHPVPFLSSSKSLAKLTQDNTSFHFGRMLGSEHIAYTGVR